MYQYSTADGVVRFTTPLHLMGLNSFGFLEACTVLHYATVLPMILIIHDLKECLKKGEPFSLEICVFSVKAENVYVLHFSEFICPLRKSYLMNIQRMN